MSMFSASKWLPTLTSASCDGLPCGCPVIRAARSCCIICGRLDSVQNGSTSVSWASSRGDVTFRSSALRSRPLQDGHAIDIVNVMIKLTTISVTTEQHQQLKEMANSEGIAMWELVDRFLRRERRRRIGQMLTETNANRTSEERLFEAAVAAAGSGSVRDALR